MNYRHAFHAGGFADVLKHIVLTRVVEYLKRKETPFFVLDTHAGQGRYDLLGEEAERSGEAAVGIARLYGDANLPELMQPYIAAVRSLQDGDGLRWYPGSPRLVRTLMRPQDRLFAVELHPVEAASLTEEFAGDRQVRTFSQDGFQAVRAFLPPKERRGVVLIDPAFEVPDEFSHLAGALRDGLRRWATGVYLLWYPIKYAAQVDSFLAEVVSICAERPALAVEFLQRKPDGVRLAGTGVVVVNPPFTMESEAASVLPYLEAMLQEGGAATGRTRWLSGPSVTS